MGSNFVWELVIRIVGAIAVVLATYNPTGTSYFHWVREGFESNIPLKVLAGIALLIAYVVLIRASIHSIRIVGMVLVGILVAAIIWVMSDWGWLSLDQPGVIDWLILLGIGFIFGIGLSWAIIRRRLSGQYTVDEADMPGDH